MALNVDIVLLVIGFLILLLLFARFVVGDCLLWKVFILGSCAMLTCGVWGPWGGVIMGVLWCCRYYCFVCSKYYYDYYYCY